LDIPHRLTENPIQEAIRNRILELLPLGVGKIWVKATAYDDFHIANILGIDIESWEELLPYSNLARANGTLKLNEWGKKLHLNVEIRRYNNSSENTFWFRFTKAIDVNDNSRGKRRRDGGLEAHQSEEVESEDKNSAPGHDGALDDLAEFYRILQLKGLLLDRTHFYSEAINCFIDEKIASQQLALLQQQVVPPIQPDPLIQSAEAKNQRNLKQQQAKILLEEAFDKASHADQEAIVIKWLKAKADKDDKVIFKVHNTYLIHNEDNILQ
jgi:hypothetical protein